VSTRIELKEAIYDAIEIPEEFVPITVTVDDSMVKAFAYTQDDYNPWCFSASPFGGRVGHAAIVTQKLLLQFTTLYDHNSVIGLHADEELWFESPVHIGETVTLRGRYIEKFEKRGNQYVTMEGEARAEDGRLVTRHRATELVRIGERTAIGAQGASTAKTINPPSGNGRAVGDATRAVEAGDTFGPLVKQTTPGQTWVFSSGGEYVTTIHTDPERARSAGLEGPVVQGQQQACYVSELLTGVFGASWFTSGWLRLKFIQPLFVGEVAIVEGIVADRNDAEDRLNVEVWVRTAAGKMTAVGWACAMVTP
jgi:acyl dehydratase